LLNGCRLQYIRYGGISVYPHQQSDQINGRGNPAPIGIAPFKIIAIGIFCTYAMVARFIGLAIGKGAAANLHVFDARRSKNMLLNVLLIRKTGHFFNDTTQYHKTYVRVGISGTGRHIQRTVVENPGNELVGRHGLVHHGRIITGIAPSAYMVRQTMFNSKIGDILFIWLCTEIMAKNGAVIVTADHGNAEQMWDPETNAPHTAHTTYDVECILVSGNLTGLASGNAETPSARLRAGGRLADVMPTVLDLMGLQPPAEMEGQSLLKL